jgi:hypothetical protein
MAINNGSRYQDSIVDYFRKEEYGTTYPVVFYQFDTLNNINYFIHNYIQGETLHGLAQKYFGRPDVWWIIAEYNPEVTDFLNISPGALLRIPNV